MDLKYYFVVLFLFKMTIAERLFRSKDNKAIPDDNLENEESNTISYTAPESKMYYLGSKVDPSFFWSQPDFKNLVIKEETEEKHDHQETNMYENELVEKLKKINFDNLTPNDEEIIIERSVTPLKDFISQLEFETDYIDNITNYEDTIDIRSGEDITNYVNNYEYNKPEPAPINIMDNLMKLRDNRNDQISYLGKEVTSPPFVPLQKIAMDLPKRILNNLPIGSIIQPRKLMNFPQHHKYKPHHHHNHHPKYLHLPKWGSLRPSYYKNHLLSKKIIFTQK